MNHETIRAATNETNLVFRFRIDTEANNVKRRHKFLSYIERKSIQIQMSKTKEMVVITFQVVEGKRHSIYELTSLTMN